jgi:hypothetical protein
MDAVSNRQQIIQRLHNAVTNKDSVSLEEAKKIYTEVHNEVYMIVSTPGIKPPTFWTKALEFASVLLLDKNWEEIKKKIDERRKNQTDPNQQNPDTRQG